MRQFAALACLLSAGWAQAADYTYVPAGEFGHRICGAPPANWRGADADERGWQIAPLPPDAGVGCGESQFARFSFDVGPELARLATLTLRAHYEHGFAAYLNGVEIARRRLDPNADPAALATETHSPEWDRLTLPLKPGLFRATGNVLAIEVHPRTPGHAPLLDVELTAADGPRIVRGPYLQKLSEREVTVVFDTDLPTLGEVRFSDDKSVTDPAPQTHHVLRLRGLSPGTPYHYDASASTQAGPMASVKEGALPPASQRADAGDAIFHTPPAAGRPLRFVVYGDVRSGHDIHAQMARSVLEEDPDLAIVTGDLVDRGSDDAEWEKFFEVAEPLIKQVAIFPAPGNHEYARLGRGVGNFLQFFRLPERSDAETTAYYSFDISGVHFVALDSNQYNSPVQKAWLDHDLAAARSHGARALFVYAHEGAWSSGPHGDNASCIRELVPVMEKHRVNLFFYGHDHHYERGRVGKLDYVLTGGGGAELRPTRCGPGTKKPCPPRVAEYINDHNYVVVEVLPSLTRVCPKRPDGTPLSECTSYKF